MIKTVYKVTRTGPTSDDVLKAAQQQYVDALVEDLKQTPDQYEGSPYKKTGELVDGIHFKPASRTGQRVGLIGKIRAPMSRFKSKWIARGFIDKFERLWQGRGQGWSRRGR